MPNWLQRLSIASLGSRHQLGIAISLITVIPALVLTYVALHGETAALGGLAINRNLLFAILVGSMVLGYISLAKYPVNMARLRRYLEKIVDGDILEEVRLIHGADDVDAIEHCLGLLVERLSGQVDSMREEMRRIEWLLERQEQPHAKGDWHSHQARNVKALPGDDAVEGLILSSVGPQVLADILGDFLELLETSAMVFEVDGRLSLDLILSDWARFVAAEFTGTPGATDSRITPTWARVVQQTLATGQAVEDVSETGLSIYAVPVMRGADVIGVLGFEYGDPPGTPAEMEALAEELGLDPEEALRKARSYRSRPAFITSLARNRISACARLIGEIVERQETENILVANEEELRKHRADLEALIADRTAELTEANVRLQAEAEERGRAERLKDDFVSTVSHELRTPLAITKEGVSLLLDGIAGDINEKQRKILTSSASNIDRLARIINDLLDISRIEAGRMEINKTRTDILTVLQQSVLSMSQWAERQGLLLELEAPGHPVEVYVDEDRILQVMTNLLANAIKFTPSGSITVTCSADETRVTCAVRDTGAGMEPDDLAHVFDKFRQFGRQDGAGEKGTGLGLAIVKNILGLHGGQITVESTVGEGTVFRFDLPLYTPETALHTALTERLDAARASERELTLCILNLECLSGTAPDLWTPACQQAYDGFVGSNALRRASDFVFLRENHQIVILAEIKPESRAGVCRRWADAVSGGFPHTGDAANIRVRHAYATARADGDDADALLEHVGQLIVAQRRLEA